MFSSVFRPFGLATPTPEVTPEIGTTTTLGEPFGVLQNTDINESVQVSRAWTLAINWLKEVVEGRVQPLDHNQQRAFELLIARPQEQISLRAWYLNAVDLAFIAMRPQYMILLEPWHGNDKQLNPLVLSSLETIQRELRKCTKLEFPNYRSSQVLLWLHDLAHAARQDWQARVTALPFRDDLQIAIVAAFHQAFTLSSIETARCQQLCQCNPTLDSLPLERMRYIGLGGRLAVAALARASQTFLQLEVPQKKCFRVDWIDHISNIPRLCMWTQTRLATAIQTATARLNGQSPIWTPARITELADAAVAGLGYYRLNNLFDYIKAWPHSEGAIEDIRGWLGDKDMQRKALLCFRCDSQLHERLLHIGASTVQILDIYVNLIHVFTKLDARGVLLEKVSTIVRNYLRSRSDTANVIARSLLAEPARYDRSADQTTCKLITAELDSAVHEPATNTSALDWDNMRWEPEPIDAGPNHRNARAKDVLSHVLSLYDPDEFIKETEAVFAEQLLRSKDNEIVRETRLLEVLKSRLDAAKIQNLEIMLKDVRDSIAFEKRFLASTQPPRIPTPREIQASIPPDGIGVAELYGMYDGIMKRTQFHACLKLVAVKREGRLYPKRGRLPYESPKKPNTDAAFQIRVLSSEAWPQMRSSTFAVPAPIAEKMQQAEERFNALSGQRRLQWRPALGTTSVTLELEDRTVIASDVPAWFSVVIHAFGDREQQTSSIADLVQQLQMSEELVREAIAFWVSKRVLHQQPAGRYAVLERLETDAMDLSPAVEVEQDTFSAVKPQDAVLREQAATFESFIANMLRNGGPKPIGGMMGITGMMRMVLPTFTYGDEEVLWLLNQMQTRGEVVNDGDSWKVVAA